MHLAVPLLLAATAGFSHAFEADHLVAVGNIVTRRTTYRAALKDGVFWGLGHTSTILLVAGLYLLGRLVLEPATFQLLEAGVGVMLIGLGGYRLWKVLQPLPQATAQPEPAFSLAYGVGMMHGLAGSGALLLSVLTQVQGQWSGLGYLLLFGVGTVVGMMVAAGVFSLPFSVGMLHNERWRRRLTVLSSAVCVGLGLQIIWENVVA